MPRKREICKYRGCGEIANYIIEVNGRRVFLCRNHYRRLLRRLEERALERGEATLEELALTEGKEGFFALSFSKRK